MKIIVHRGTKQIGGCATEISTNNTRILIDFGENLPDSSKSTSDKNLVIEGLNSGSPNFDGVLFTHYHCDHIGHIEQIPKEIPVYLGETAITIYKRYIKRINKKNVYYLDKIIPLKDFKAVTIGDIKVTPIPADHSAYNAHMFLIEAEGRKILHTGDFRFHGFRGVATINVLSKYIKNLDLLIVEGTNLSKTSTSRLSEYELQKDIRKVIKNNKYIFVLCASTNIDRLASFYNATPRGRYFICTDYQKSILYDVAKSSDFKWYRFNKALTYGKNLKLKERGFVYVVTANVAMKKIMESFPDSVLIYSMWRGYLDGRNSNLSEFMKPYIETDRIKYLHSSGHASKEDLELLCNQVKPNIGIIPIHSESPKLFERMNLNNPVILLNDREEYKL